MGIKRAREQNGGGDFRHDFYGFLKRLMGYKTCQCADIITTCLSCFKVQALKTDCHLRKKFILFASKEALEE